MFLAISFDQIESFLSIKKDARTLREQTLARLAPIHCPAISINLFFGIKGAFITSCLLKPPGVLSRVIFSREASLLWSGLSLLCAQEI